MSDVVLSYDEALLAVDVNFKAWKAAQDEAEALRDDVEVLTAERDRYKVLLAGLTEAVGMDSTARIIADYRAGAD